MQNFKKFTNSSVMILAGLENQSWLFFIPKKQKKKRKQNEAVKGFWSLYNLRGTDENEWPDGCKPFSQKLPTSSPRKSAYNLEYNKPSVIKVSFLFLFLLLRPYASNRFWKEATFKHFVFIGIFWHLKVNLKYFINKIHVDFYKYMLCYLIWLPCWQLDLIFIFFQGIPTGRTWCGINLGIICYHHKRCILNSCYILAADYSLKVIAAEDRRIGLVCLCVSFSCNLISYMIQAAECSLLACSESKSYVFCWPKVYIFENYPVLNQFFKWESYRIIEYLNLERTHRDHWVKNTKECDSWPFLPHIWK